MKTAFTLLVLCAASLAAASADQTPAAQADTAPAPVKKKTKAAAKKPANTALTIPASAKPNPDGTFSYTDKSGKKWRYVKSPFGVMRSVDSDEPSSAANSDPGAAQFVKAVDNGDTVTIVRQTPFGPISAEKKKADLTDDERRMLADQKAKP